MNILDAFMITLCLQVFYVAWFKLGVQPITTSQLLDVDREQEKLP